MVPKAHELPAEVQGPWQFMLLHGRTSKALEDVDVTECGEEVILA